MATPEQLAELKHDWDSYGGQPITPKAIAAARTWLDTLCFVPTSDGGIQIEAHSLNAELEISIRPDGMLDIAESSLMAARAYRLPTTPEAQVENLTLAAPVRDGMRRLTADDWNLINDALALYEASAGDLYLSSPEQAKLEQRIADVREKVHERTNAL